MVRGKKEEELMQNCCLAAIAFFLQNWTSADNIEDTSPSIVIVMDVNYSRSIDGRRGRKWARLGERNGYDKRS